jgi:hypothetical protein
MHSRTGTAHYRSTTSGSGQPKTTVQTTSVAMGWGQLRSRSCAYEQEEGGRENEQSGSGGRDQRSKRRCASLFPARKTSSPRGGAQQWRPKPTSSTGPHYCMILLIIGLGFSLSSSTTPKEPAPAMVQPGHLPTPTTHAPPPLLSPSRTATSRGPPPS